LDTCRLYPESKIYHFLHVSRSWTCSTVGHMYPVDQRMPVVPSTCRRTVWTERSTCSRRAASHAEWTGCHGTEPWLYTHQSWLTLAPCYHQCGYSLLKVSAYVDRTVYRTLNPGQDSLSFRHWVQSATVGSATNVTRTLLLTSDLKYTARAFVCVWVLSNRQSTRDDHCHRLAANKHRVLAPYMTSRRSR